MDTTTNVYNAIVQLTATGKLPTVREIKAYANLSSTSVVNHHVNLLIKAGSLEKVYHTIYLAGLREKIAEMVEHDYHLA